LFENGKVKDEKLFCLEFAKKYVPLFAMKFMATITNIIITSTGKRTGGEWIMS